MTPPVPIEVPAGREAVVRQLLAPHGELAALAMPNAAVEIAVDQTETAESGLLVGERRLAFGRHGVDDVEMLLRPHAGAPSRGAAPRLDGRWHSAAPGAPDP